MSGIFLTFDHWTHNLEPTAGGPPHITLAYTKQDLGFNIKHMWGLSKHVSIIGDTLTLDRVLVSRFHHGGLGRERIDLLWCFDTDSHDILVHQMGLTLACSGQKAITNALTKRAETPFHVTLKTDISKDELEEFQKDPANMMRRGEITLTGVYVD